ncbi:MAG: hypothetical protein A4E55_01456 [Pelotomaculum sp. PtaU1.Bin035]|nr:MAG: hypothetical protein A4E55_01456 [Pelotomaculum sp. PtaU1.Bin035]
MRSVSDESGQALVLVMMIILVVLLMGSTILTLVGESRKASFEERMIIQAYYIADAGVERALAKVKSDSGWLWDAVHLDADKEVEYITDLDYSGGRISRVIIKEENIYPAAPLSKEDVAYTDILIISEGTCESSKKTLKVRARVNAPLHFCKGVWINSPESDFGKNSIIVSSITSSSGLAFRHDCIIYGDITASGDVTVMQNIAIAASEVKTTGSVILENDARINGNVRQAGTSPFYVDLSNGALIGWVEDVAGQNEIFYKDVYYNGILYNNSGRTIDESKLHHDKAGVIKIPVFPVLTMSMYENNYDVKYTGNKTFSGYFTVDGILFVTGDVTISGNYSGVGTIIAGGDVNISGDLKRYNDDLASSLSILCFGNTGITISKGSEAWALLYAPPGTPAGMRGVNIGNGARVHGSVICDKIYINSAGNTLVQYEGSLSNNQPDWVTSVVDITSWQELYSVF